MKKLSDISKTKSIKLSFINAIANLDWEVMESIINQEEINNDFFYMSELPENFQRHFFNVIFPDKDFVEFDDYIEPGFNINTAAIIACMDNKKLKDIFFNKKNLQNFEYTDHMQIFFRSAFYYDNVDVLHFFIKHNKIENDEFPEEAENESQANLLYKNSLFFEFLTENFIEMNGVSYDEKIMKVAINLLIDPLLDYLEDRKAESILDGRDTYILEEKINEEFLLDFVLLRNDDVFNFNLLMNKKLQKKQNLAKIIHSCSENTYMLEKNKNISKKDVLADIVNCIKKNHKIEDNILEIILKKDILSSNVLDSKSGSNLSKRSIEDFDKFIKERGFHQEFKKHIQNKAISLNGDSNLLNYIIDNKGKININELQKDVKKLCKLIRKTNNFNVKVDLKLEDLVVSIVNLEDEDLKLQFFDNKDLLNSLLKSKNEIIQDILNEQIIPVLNKKNLEEKIISNKCSKKKKIL